MKIDAHQHFWKYDPDRDGWITEYMSVIRRDFFPSDLEPVLKRNGIDGCVAVQAAQSEEETDFLLGLAAANPFVKGVVGWIDLREANLARRMERFRGENALKGFRHVVQGEPDGFLRQGNFIRGVHEIARSGYTYDLLIYARQLDDAIYFASKTTDVKIVIDHIAKPSIREGEIAEWRRGMSALARHENIYCKLSGIVTEAHWQQWTTDDLKPYLDTVLELFGSHRLMYGSDWPVCLVAASYERQMQVVTECISVLSPPERSRIMGGTAKEFYNIKHS